MWWGDSFEELAALRQRAAALRAQTEARRESLRDELIRMRYLLCIVRGNIEAHHQHDPASIPSSPSAVDQ